MTCLTSLLPPPGGGGAYAGRGASALLHAGLMLPCCAVLALSFSLTHSLTHTHVRMYAHTNSPSPSLYVCLPACPLSSILAMTRPKVVDFRARLSGRLLLFIFFYHTVCRVLRHRLAARWG